MKFLTDQDVYAVTVHYLLELGYEVITAYEIGFSESELIFLCLLRFSCEPRSNPNYTTHNLAILISVA